MRFARSRSRSRSLSLSLSLSRSLLAFNFVSISILRDRFPVHRLVIDSLSGHPLEPRKARKTKRKGT